MTQELWDKLRDDGAPEALLAADGSPRLPHVGYDDDGYPCADDQPMAHNARQADQLFYAYPALKSLLHKRFPDACAAADMFVHPRKGDLAASVVPNIFVAFDAGDNARNSYKLWDEPVPSFVLEVHSGTTADNDLGEKRGKYAAMGIAEFWVFDPFGVRIAGHVAGLRLRDGVYEPITPLPGTRIHRSDVLGLEFRAEGDNLRIHDPKAGEDLLSYEEKRAGRIAAESRRLAAELARQGEQAGRVAAAAREFAARLAQYAARSRELAATLARQETREQPPATLAQREALEQVAAAVSAQQEAREQADAAAAARHEAEERAPRRSRLRRTAAAHAP